MTEKKHYISRLSVFSSLAVVMLHCNGVSLNYQSEPHWFLGNAIENMFYFAVPVFFMITGTTLLDYPERYDLKTYLKKRFSKTVIPYIAFNFIAMLYKLTVLTDLSWESVGIKSILGWLLCGNMPGVYWFFIPLFCVYLSIPVFSRITKENKITVYSYAVVCGLLINSALPTLLRIMNVKTAVPVTFYPAVSYMIFVLMGYVIANRRFSRRESVTIYVSGILALCLQLFGTYYMSVKAGYLVDTLKGYTGITCAVYSAAVFLFFKENVNRKSAVITKISRYTMAVYLLHWFVMTLINTMLSLDMTTVGYRFVMPFIVYAVSVGISWLIRKIPFGKIILPE